MSEDSINNYNPVKEAIKNEIAVGTAAQNNMTDDVSFSESYERAKYVSEGEEIHTKAGRLLWDKSWALRSKNIATTVFDQTDLKIMELEHDLVVDWTKIDLPGSEYTFDAKREFQNIKLQYKAQIRKSKDGPLNNRRLMTTETKDITVNPTMVRRDGFGSKLKEYISR